MTAPSSLQVSTPDGSFGGYLAVPASGSGPGLILIQEIFGVNHVMRDLCDHYASQGFVAFCPDLFWRIEPGIQLTDKTDAEWARAFELFKAFDVEAGVKDLQAAITTLRDHSATTDKVGAVGFCLGGLLAYLTACHTDAAASVSYYGVGIQDRLSDAETIRAPLLMHMAEKDQFVPPEAQTAIHEGLANNEKITRHSYVGQDHAFAREGGAHYHAESATLANERSLAFLKTHLG